MRGHDRGPVDRANHGDRGNQRNGATPAVTSAQPKCLTIVGEQKNRVERDRQ
jgi:hypothetical protein